MGFKERMIKDLSDMLGYNETLMYPIYGTLQQGNEQEFAFFGFADNHLLISMLSGKKNRVPLDIESVNVKKTLILKQHIIDISIKDGPIYSITVSPAVLGLKSQKENFPQFLNFLQNKAYVSEPSNLDNTGGCKIRYQYFNIPIYMFLSFFPAVLIMIFTSEMKHSYLSLEKSIEIITTFLVVFGGLLVPIIILSLLNRFLFGETVCIANEEGLIIKNRFIPWKYINNITYTPDISSRWHIRYTYATISIKPNGKSEYSIDILHFPLYGLKKIKKHAPDVKISLGKNSMFLLSLWHLSLR